ncbi:MAG: BlaI/MecI/CopY family transcriptional regulator [Gemmatimonadales bacterium]|nr:MAG: BlaI/MecI/CopY family transcriptional regulator [Gemmatimonadales bacterium]
MGSDATRVFVSSFPLPLAEAHMAEVSFTDRELDVMSILWREGSGTVAEVREALEDDLGYTSVLKVLQILEEKGFVDHEKEGRAYRYFPLVEASQAGASALDRVVDKIFHGSAELTLARLVSARKIPPGELEAMRRLLDELDELDDEADES